MRKIVFLFIIFTLITIQTQSYAIQGLWKLTDVDNIRLSDDHPAKMQITDFIFRNKTIRWKLALNGCQNLKSMIDIQNNYIFVDNPTIFANNQSLKNCSKQYLKPQKIFTTSLSKVFTFQVISNFMIFSDPQGTVLFKFARLAQNNIKDKLLGVWMINSLYGQQIPQIIQINNSLITYCQRLAETNYQIVSNNKFVFSNQSNDHCGSKKLLEAFNSSRFFVKRNNTLQIYNQADDLVLSLVYVMDLQTAKKQRQQQQQQIKNYVPPPPPPRPPQPFQPPEIPKFISNSPPSQTLRLPTMADLSGKWSITKISTGPISTTTAFIITNSAILLASQCITYTIGYSITNPNPISIKQQNFRKSKNQCPNKKLQIDQNDIIKIYRFQVQVIDQKSIVRIYDQDNKQLLQIQRPGRLILQPLPAPSSNIPMGMQMPSTPFSPPSTTTPKSDIESARYTILLLRRRDIPRKIIDISNNSFILKICNQITVNIVIASNKSIQLKTSKNNISSSSCDTTQQNVFLDTMSNAASYIKDQQDYILKDKNDKEIISFNYIS